jgi:hypothetical protein
MPSGPAVGHVGNGGRDRSPPPGMNFSASSVTRIVDAPEGAIEDVVAAVGDVGLPVDAEPQPDLSAAARVRSEHLDHVARRGDAEAGNLHGERKGAERFDLLRGVGDHDHAVGGGRDDLLRNSAPPPLIRRS